MGLKDAFKVYKPQLYTGIGIGAFIAAIAHTIFATVEATHEIDRQKEEIQKNSVVEIKKEDIKIPTKQVIKSTIKYYVKPAIFTGIGIGFTSKGISDASKNYDGLMTTYLLTKAAEKAYHEEVTETIGEKKEEKIQQAAAENHIESLDNSKVPYATGTGNDLHYIEFFELPFRASINSVNGAMVDFLSDLTYEEMSGEQLLEYLGIDLERTEGYKGNALEIMGWRPSDKLKFSVSNVIKNNEPTRIIRFNVNPYVGFDKIHDD